jgi:AhpD family alkylhydroperoxidase
MTPRITNTFLLAPATMKAMVAVEGAIRASGLDTTILDLVKLRASQINGCAYCLAMHASEARNQGETEMRITMLPAWRESTLFSDRERAALAWTEALTLLAATRAPDEDWAQVRAQFSDAEIVQLTFAVGAINLWNRLQVGLRATPEHEAAGRVP